MSSKESLQYTSVEDLLQKAKINYKEKKPVEVYKRLSAMYKLAETAKIKRDEEQQYIMLKRWLNSMEWLKTTREYKDDKKFSVNVDQMNEAKKTLVDLSRKLDVRYESRMKEKMLKRSNSTEKMDIDIDIGTDSHMTPIDGPIKLPETPTRDPLVSDNEDVISCDHLYCLLHSENDRYLIIDIRPKLEFEVSRILCTRVINIPNNKIKCGVLASSLEKVFSKKKDWLDLYKHRGAQYVDIIVLIDRDTSSKTLMPDNPMNTLRKVFLEWDLGTKYKRIAILDGGYTEWIARYPTLTTNPKIEEPTVNNVQDELLDIIDYPDFSDDEENIVKSNENVPHNSKTANKNETTSRGSLTNAKTWLNTRRSNYNHSAESNSIHNPDEGENVSKNNTILREYNDNSSRLQQKRTSSVMKNETPTKPTVDRSSKPVTLQPSNSESKIVLKLLKDLHEFGKGKQKLDEEMLERERTLFVQRSGKYKNPIEKENVQEDVEALLRLKEMDQKYKNIENELGKYYANGRIGSIKFSPAEETEKGNLEWNICKLKRRMKDTTADRQKLQQEVVENDDDDDEEDSTKENELNVYKEPLKMENNSSPMGGGLERSYSSPNLSQHPGITGLKNLGNSCYMNSIIQCLSNTTHLAKYFMDNLYADDLNTNNDNNTQGQVVEEVAQVIKALWRGQYKSISPHDLKIAVGQYKLQFESYEQQDSHEFLTFLLDWMHNDLKKNCKVPPEMTAAEKAWNKAMGGQRSIISDLFFGQLRSTIMCSFCKQSSTTYETFNSLTTSLPDSNRCTLNDCIQKFVSGQKVLGWKCPKCQMAREAMKKFDFVKLPPIIVIHLNRFAESGGWLEKRNTAVDFPLTDFNLKQYLVTDGNSITITNIRNYSYSLYAMSNHYGTMEGGHYTAFCKNAAQNKWYKYDDQTVTEVTASQVKSQNTNAYLLFYTSFSTSII
ncbi:ubiquitin carboxyl-terminal hydrolase 8-like isoform X2 [Ceratina calcarata]|uniref:Ubiquitin carboxyl-terminal hydrolase n=1 Tax=Ceratina calcarata TaxID=156304 RepID=A0AAJ7RVY1_9HYME|nr:ubiquitin carboxyl-terminal hydrolase 8-like isoform X2 [Ceratina calcarata]